MKLLSPNALLALGNKIQLEFGFEKNVSAGSAKANGREPKTGLGRVFNYKLGCYDDVHVIIYTDAHSYL